MTFGYLEILVEEPSARAALDVLVPRIVPEAVFEIREFPGKHKLLKELPARMRGYVRWARVQPVNVVVLVDRDRDDCGELKGQLSRCATDAGLTVSARDSATGTVLPRIVMPELESWFIGDVPALRRVYPKLPSSTGEKAKYRAPDEIVKASRALEALLQEHNYHKGGLRKLELASDVAPHMDVDNNNSASFQCFRDGLRRLVKGEN